MAGHSSPPIEVAGASQEEAAAVLAAIEQFTRETEPTTAPAPLAPAISPWKRAALLEGVSGQPDQ